MSDRNPLKTPVPPGPGYKLNPVTRRQYRLSDEHSPTRQRLHDDLLSQLTPLSAVDVLDHPTPSLKACLDAATANERDFVMRTAVASQKIYEWLDELLEWPWPADGGSAGFEAPSTTRKKLFLKETIRCDNRDSSIFLGSLAADDVAAYDDRVEQISHELDDLELDDIKTHVLHNHILPLSRPGTPLSDTGRPIVSMATFNRLDDLAAVITAIIMQALPNLSKLSRMLNTWRIRITVLRGIPSLLAAITDAEVALESGWSVISAPPRNPVSALGSPGQEPGLTNAEFDIMKVVLQKKITRPGRDLDAMLDSLEGQTDTVPESWIDRMEATEHGYAAWYVACERKIREAEWAKTARAKAAINPPQKPMQKATTGTIGDGSPLKLRDSISSSSTRAAPVPITIQPPIDDVVDDVSSDKDTETQTRDMTPPKTPVKSQRLSATLEPKAQDMNSSSGHPSRSPLRTPVSFHKRYESYDGSADDVDPVKYDF
ncbi:hypothetical protein ACHAPN_003571 [Verticillium nonalfalfae]